LAQAFVFKLSFFVFVFWCNVVIGSIVAETSCLSHHVVEMLSLSRFDAHHRAISTV